MSIEAIEPFLDEGLIDEVLYQLKSGKEADVFVCAKGAQRFAAKAYKARGSRAFHNDVAYRAGRAILDDRVARAVSRGTRFGREAGQSMWVGHEFATLRALRRAGVDVPEPVASCDGAILLSLVTLAGEPAPQLREVRPEPDEARAILDALLRNVETMLAYDVIHADLSPFNVLVGDAGPVIIDVPQAVDPRSNPNARELFFRDVENVCRWAQRFGAYETGAAIAGDLWNRWERAML